MLSNKFGVNWLLVQEKKWKIYFQDSSHVGHLVYLVHLVLIMAAILAMSTRLCLLQWLIWFLSFRFDALTELGAFMWTEFLCISVLRVASGPRVKLVSCKSALTPPPPPVVCSTDRSKAVVPVLVLLVVALWFILRGDLLYVFPYVILVFFSPFSIAITSLEEERANLSAFRTFVRFVLV